MNKILLGLLGILLLLGVWGLSAYNSLITAEESVQTQWAQVETQYQRRLDLIPNLVESVQGILEQEQEVFGQLAEARTRYAGAQTVGEQVQAVNQLESALSRLLVIVENYPELRSSETMQTFMAQLEGTENRISVERGRYNETVQSYNLQVRRFPGNIIAGFLGFEPLPRFEATEGAETAPSVEFN